MTKVKANRSLANNSAIPTTQRSLPIVLLRAREAVMCHFRPMLAEHGVTEQQWRVIRVLDETGSLDATELADRAYILAPSLTRMLRTLEERDLIVRDKDMKDGRRILLSLTPAGKALIAKVGPDSHDIHHALETRYGVDRVAQLLDMLDELATLK